MTVEEFLINLPWITPNYFSEDASVFVCSKSLYIMNQIMDSRIKMPKLSSWKSSINGQPLARLSSKSRFVWK